MSQSIAQLGTQFGTYRGVQKSTCRKCNRTVYVVRIDGVKYETDPELINVVSHTKPPRAELARRLHGELCVRYQVQNDKIKWIKEQKKNKKKPT